MTPTQFLVTATRLSIILVLRDCHIPVKHRSRMYGCNKLYNRIFTKELKVFFMKTEMTLDIVLAAFSTFTIDILVKMFWSKVFDKAWRQYSYFALFYIISAANRYVCLSIVSIQFVNE